MSDDDLRDLLTDAVADVEPAYRLDVIRARTQQPHRRRGWLAAGGAILAAAAVVTAVSVVSDDRPRREPPASSGGRATALYFVGDTPAGPRLYREFQRLPSAGGALAALDAITTRHGPDDPDYRSRWPGGSFRSVTVRDSRIDIELDPLARHVSGRLALQQLVFTAQAATGTQLPVRVRTDGAEDVLVEREPENQVLSLVSISDPAEGLRVTDSFMARGRADSPEANVPWQVTDASGAVVLEGFATALGWGDRLYPWETEPIDVSDLAPGRYTYVAMTEDPSGGEGFGPFTDTRTIIVD